MSYSGVFAYVHKNVFKYTICNESTQFAIQLYARMNARLQTRTHTVISTCMHICKHVHK